MSAEKDVARCCICDEWATRLIATRGLAATAQTVYCDRHAAELLARATRVAAPEGSAR